MRDRGWWLVVALCGALMVMAGAFGAHALNGTLSARLMAVYETAVRYQAWHTLAMLGVLAWRAARPLPGQRLTLGLWLAGMGLFSGSLYALAITGVKVLGAITPLGGGLLIAGWLVLAATAWRRQSASGNT
ncbi:DUF423 domain-containing protein [Halomonas organivorans]|uniref:Uncharacterized membrane protein YgdD (TMEM256/DUF423 family) n=1 Tax=Halomonas organivorans TaxID=257772 RepID=A0A7W5BYY2_9GAMM|nr:DUF423 domain-containing protein [Halomonas organivorans]MBB3141369.1 uncharacterized membrane protein YgdD (TMEM256/DUF423 family) [Halomonas organivorans]